MLIALPHQDDWLAAKQFQAEFMLSFWDALLIAVCDRHGVKTLYSEDFGRCARFAACKSSILSSKR